MIVEKIKFQTFEEFATYAMSDAAPRYALLSWPMNHEPDSCWGLTFQEALFSNDIDKLKRAAIKWDQNRLTVEYSRGPDYADEYGTDVSDSWSLRGGPEWWELLGAPAELSKASAEKFLIDENFFCDMEGWSLYDRTAPTTYGERYTIDGVQQIMKLLADRREHPEAGF